MMDVGLTLSLSPKTLCHAGKKLFVSHLDSGSGVSLGLIAMRSVLSSQAVMSSPRSGNAAMDGLSNHCLRKSRSIGLGPCILVRATCFRRASSK